GGSCEKLSKVNLTGVLEAQKLFLASFCAACASEVELPAASQEESIWCSCLIASNGKVQAEPTGAAAKCLTCVGFRGRRAASGVNSPIASGTSVAAPTRGWMALRLTICFRS